MARPGIKPRSPGPLANTLTTRTMGLATNVREEKTLNSKHNGSREMDPDNESDYSTCSSNSKSICQKNDIMAQEYSSLAEERDKVNGRAQLIKLEEYHSEKENSLYPTVFVNTDYLATDYHGNIITITQGVVFALY